MSPAHQYREDMGDGLPFVIIIKKTRILHFKTMRLVPLSSFKFHKAKEIDEKVSFLFVCVNDKSKRSFLNGFLQFLEPGFI